MTKKLVLGKEEMVLNDTKSVLNEDEWPHNHKDQFGIIQNLQMSPIPQTSFLVGTFFAISYSKTTLVSAVFCKYKGLLDEKLLISRPLDSSQFPEYGSGVKEFP